MAQAQATSLELPTEQDLERFNDARNYFFKVMKLWNDRLTLKGSSQWEQYLSGRAALILDCEFSRVFQRERMGGLGKKRSELDLHAFIVLKAYSKEPHKLEHWDNELMLIHDVEFVKSPQGVIPSLVGLYDIVYETENRGTNLLFQSAVHNGFKFLSALENWKLSMLCEFAASGDNALPEKDVQSASQIVDRVPHNLRSTDSRKLLCVEINKEFAPPEVFFNSKGVEVRSFDSADNSLQVRDMLFGPFNF